MRRRLASLSVGLLLAACGSRSALSPSGAGAGEGGAAGGTGGAATTGTGASPATGTGTGTGASSSGGSGGAPAGSCDVLVVDGPPLSPVPWVAGDKQVLPWLAATEPDGSRAAFVYAERENDAAPFFRSSSVALDAPWGAWSSELGTSAFHGLADAFAVGAASDGRFTMLTTDEPNNAGDVPTGMVVWAPEAGAPGAMGQFFDDVPPGVPVLVTSNGADYLAGHQRFLANDLHHLSLSRVVFGAGPVSATDVVACSLQTPVSGGAIPFGGGFLATFSNGRPYNHCLRDDLPDAPPTRLQLVKVVGDPIDGVLMFEEQQLASHVVQARLAGSEGGAWAGWERVPFDGPSDRRLHLLRIDAEGFPFDGHIIEVGGGTVASPIAVASLGELVALATTGVEGLGPRQLTVRILNGEGDVVGAITLGAGDAFDMDADVALLASPKGDRLLVAWSESSAVDNDDRRVRLARIACVGP